MTQPPDSGPVEFMHIAGHAVRVTSYRSDAAGGTIELVIIARGTRDAEVMRELLARGVLDIEIPGQPPFAARVENAGIRETGSGQTTITRFGFTLVRSDRSPAVEPRSLEERVAELERQVSVLTGLVRDLSRPGT